MPPEWMRRDLRRKRQRTQGPVVVVVGLVLGRLAGLVLGVLGLLAALLLRGATLDKVGDPSAEAAVIWII